jgi:hypothetical protein
VAGSLGHATLGGRQAVVDLLDKVPPCGGRQDDAGDDEGDDDER